jgi:tetratricopeptide (TPR) repeat protein
MNLAHSPWVHWVFYPALFLTWAATVWVQNQDYSYLSLPFASAPNAGHLSKYFFQEDKLVAGINELGNSLPREKRIAERGYIRHNIGVLYLKRYKQNNTPALLDTATTFFSAAVRENPRIAQAYYNLGRIYTEQNRPDSAAGYYRQAIQDDPHYALALYNLGYYFYQEKKQLDSAEYYTRLALECNPGIPLANFILGCIAQARQQYPLALEYYTKETARNPDLALSYSKLGEIYSRYLKDPEKAREALKKYLELSRRKAL